MTEREYNHKVFDLYSYKCNKEKEIACSTYESQGCAGLLRMMLMQAKEMVYQCESLQAEYDANRE